MSDLLTPQQHTLPHILSFFPVTALPRLREVCKAFNNIIGWYLGNLEKVSVSPTTNLSVLNTLVPLCPKLTLLNLSGCKLDQLGILQPYVLANIQSLCMISCKFGHGDIFNLLLQTKVTHIHICFSDISYCRPLLKFATKSVTIREINTCFCYDEDSSIVNSLIDIASKRAKAPEPYKLDIIQKVSDTAPNYLTSIFPLLFSWIDMGVNILQLPCLNFILSLLPDSESDWESLQRLSSRVPDFTKTLFMYALQARRVTTATFLLQKGVKVPSEEGYQLLLRSMLTTQYNVVLLDALLSVPEHVHKMITFEGRYHGTILHMFLRVAQNGVDLGNTTQRILRLGFNLDTRDSNNQTVLHIACHRHLMLIINMILSSKHKFDIDAKDNANRTPLRLALSPDAYSDNIPTYPEFQRISCIKLITQGADINVVDNQNKSILDYAIQANFIDVIALLISKRVHITPAVLVDHGATFVSRPAVGVMLVKYLFECYLPSKMQSDLGSLLRRCLEKFSVNPVDLPSFSEFVILIFTHIDLNGTSFSAYNFFRMLISKCVAASSPPFDLFFTDLLRNLLFLYSQKCGDTNLPYTLIPFAEMEKQDMACYLRTEEILRGFLTVTPPPHAMHLSHAAEVHSQSPIHLSLPANPRSTSPRQIDTPPLTYPRAASPPPPTPMCTSPPPHSMLHPPNNFGNPATTSPPLYTSSPINFMPRTTSPSFMPRTASPNFVMSQPGHPGPNNSFLPRAASPNFPPVSPLPQPNPNNPRTASPATSLPHFPPADFSSNFLRPSYTLAPPPSSTLNLNPMYNLNSYHLPNPPHVHQPQFVPTSQLLDPHSKPSAFNSFPSPPKDSRPTTSNLFAPIPTRHVESHSPSAFSPPSTPSSPPYPDTPPNTPYQPDPPAEATNNKKNIFSGRKWAFYDDGKQSFYEQKGERRDMYDDDDTDMDTDNESSYDQSNKIT